MLGRKWPIWACLCCINTCEIFGNFVQKKNRVPSVQPYFCTWFLWKIWSLSNISCNDCTLVILFFSPKVLNSISFSLGTWTFQDMNSAWELSLVFINRFSSVHQILSFHYGLKVTCVEICRPSFGWDMDCFLWNRIINGTAAVSVRILYWSQGEGAEGHCSRILFWFSLDQEEGSAHSHRGWMPD